jgi:apolipoprotein D and lipocalin family protein
MARMLLMLGLLVITATAQAAQPLTSVPRLDVPRYAGQWYEIAHLPMRYQKDCLADITANYTVKPDGSIAVRNTCRTAKGTDVAEGVARPVPGHPARLEVSFAPGWLSWLPFVWADYWVIAIDPDYQWAIVGEPDRDYLWILSRSPSMERARFETLKARAAAMGYDLEPLIIPADTLR